MLSGPSLATSVDVTTIKIASWNVNSVRARIDIVERLLTEEQPDVLCLQETKALDEVFPAELFRKHGYVHQHLNGQKMHHGVAIVSLNRPAVRNAVTLGMVRALTRQLRQWRDDPSITRVVLTAAGLDGLLDTCKGLPHVSPCDGGRPSSRRRPTSPSIPLGS